MSDSLNIIWLISFGKITDNFQIFPGSVSWNPVKEHQMDVQSGVPPPSPHTHTLSFSLKHSYLSRLTASVFIYFPTTSLLFFIHVFVLFSTVWSFDVWVSDAQFTCIYSSSWFIFLCHLDISLCRFHFIEVFLFYSLGVRCFYKPAGVSLCDLQFSVC